MGLMIKGLLKMEVIIIFTISILDEHIEAIESITTRLFCFNHPIHQHPNHQPIMKMYKKR